MTPEQQTPASVVERLTDPNFAGPMQHLRDWSELDRLHTEAAALIERLSAEQEVLRGALDFAKLQLWRHPVRSDVTLVLSRIEAALTQGESRQTEETGWLIETDDNGLRYRTATRWTADASDGLRFARREDAEAFLAAFETDHFRTVATPARRVAEHRWG